MNALLILMTLALSCATAAAEPVESVISPDQQRQVEASVDRALKWLATQQTSGGSFQSLDPAQPAVTGLCVLGFLSRGHLPAQGPYSENLARGIKFILACQRDDGLLSFKIPRQTDGNRQPGHTALYNHAIAGLALAEAYGMADRDLSARMRPVIERAVEYSLQRQLLPKRQLADVGGWRYLVMLDQHNADLSVTSWQLLFLRSARNAGFAVPEEPIDQALEFVRRQFDERRGQFLYNRAEDRPTTRAMTAAGILSMSLGGKHETPIARAAGDWLLAHPFTGYHPGRSSYERYFYGNFYCSQAMFQLGGKYWRGFYPSMAAAMIEVQEEQGCWGIETAGDAEYGKTYPTALAILALDTPYQLLPIFQR